MPGIVAVALGGAIGAALRYGISELLTPRLSGDFPWHTLIVNMTGAFLLGLLMTLLVDRQEIGAWWRLFLGVGLLGGYTTFSTLAFETVELTRQGAIASAALNSIGSIVLGVTFAALGIWVAKVL